MERTSGLRLTIVFIRRVLSELIKTFLSFCSVLTTWVELQTTVNCFIDSSKDPRGMKDVAPGLRQVRNGWVGRSNSTFESPLDLELDSKCHLVLYREQKT